MSLDGQQTSLPPLTFRYDLFISYARHDLADGEVDFLIL